MADSFNQECEAPVAQLDVSNLVEFPQAICPSPEMVGVPVVDVCVALTEVLPDSPQDVVLQET